MVEISTIRENQNKRSTSRGSLEQGNHPWCLWLAAEIPRLVSEPATAAAHLRNVEIDELSGCWVNSITDHGITPELEKQRPNHILSYTNNSK